MTITINRDEVSLNGTKFKITGNVRKTLASVFPEKQVTGDYSVDSDPIASTWGMKNQTAGILLEEFDVGKPEQKYRAWWSTANLSFDGITLPPAATDTGAGGLTSKDAYILIDYDGVTYVSLDEYLRSFDNTNDDWNDAVATLAGNPTDAKICLNALMIACDDNGYYYNPKLFIANDLTDGELDIWTDATTLTNWTEDSVGGGAIAREETIVDSGMYAAKLTSAAVGEHAQCYRDLTWNPAYQGKLFQVTARVHAVTTANDADLILDDGTTTVNFSPTGTGAYETVTATMTLAANATRMRIRLRTEGDADGANVVYFDKVQVSYTETTAPLLSNKNEAKYFVEWDDKAFKIKANGQLSYSTDLVAWTDNAKLNLPDDYCQGLFIYRDADGTEIIYASTKQGFYALDYANAKFLYTEMALPFTTNAGLGADRWRTSSYISSGLSVYEYTAGVVASIRQIGLDTDGGLEPTYDGVITKLIRGHNQLFALVDASLTGGTTYSGVYEWDGKGWQARWVSGTANKPIKCGLVSSSYSEYRFFFGTDNKIYHFTIQKTIQKPKKISGYTYGAAAVHITPWFDAGWADASKTAVRFKIKTSGCSATSTLIVKYRTNHTNTDLSTGWTTASTITTNTTTTYSFASGVGAAFTSIQFRFDFANSTATDSPVIEWFSLSYLQNLLVKWTYQFTVDCTEAYNNKTPSQLLDAVVTATEATTLVVLGFRNDVGATETYNGKVFSVNGQVESGLRKEGQYTLQFVAP